MLFPQYPTMKFKILTSLILIFVFSVFSVNSQQEKNESRLSENSQISDEKKGLKAGIIDEFGSLDNDSLLARVYNLSVTLQNTNGKGFIIIYGEKSNPLKKYLAERRLKGCYKWGGFSTENVEIALGEEVDDLKFQFWKIPNGAEKPVFIEINRSYDLSGLNKPQLIYKSTYSYEFCPLYFDLEFYSKFLKANRNLTGKIVISEKNRSEYQAVKKKYLQMMKEINNFPLKQIQFVKGKYYEEPDNEFWLVPQKKR